jgi:hypothetical protein
MEVISVDDLETTEAGEDDAVWEHIRENVQYEDVAEIIGNALLLEGDQHIEGHLDVDDRLAIDGSLVVDGTISVPEGGALFVSGAVRCQNFYAEGDFVARSLNVEHALVGFYEAGITYADKAAGKVFLCGNHSFELVDTDFEHEIDMTDHPPKDSYSEEAKVLTATAIQLAYVRPRKAWEGDDDAGVDDSDWIEALRADDVAITS